MIRCLGEYTYILWKSKHSTEVLSFPVAVACSTRMQNELVYNLLFQMIAWLMAVFIPFSVLYYAVIRRQ